MEIAFSDDEKRNIKDWLLYKCKVLNWDIADEFRPMFMEVFVFILRESSKKQHFLDFLDYLDSGAGNSIENFRNETFATRQKFGIKKLMYEKI